MSTGVGENKVRIFLSALANQDRARSQIVPEGASREQLKRMAVIMDVIPPELATAMIDHVGGYFNAALGWASHLNDGGRMKLVAEKRRELERAWRGELGLNVSDQIEHLWGEEQNDITRGAVAILALARSVAKR